MFSRTTHISVRKHLNFRNTSPIGPPYYNASTSRRCGFRHSFIHSKREIYLGRRTRDHCFENIALEVFSLYYKVLHFISLFRLTFTNSFNQLQPYCRFFQNIPISILVPLGLYNSHRLIPSESSVKIRIWSNQTLSL